MNEIVLHIGAHKTGSTYLQKMFSDNSGALRNEGVYYPEEWKFLWGHHRAVELLATPLKSNVFFEEFSHLDVQSSEKILISSENFESISASAIDGLGRFSEFGKVRVVFYFREFQSLAYSLWQEEVKHGSTVEFKEFLYEHVSKPYLSKAINGCNVLDKYAAVFGQDNISIFLYDHEVSNGRDMYSSFLSEIFQIQVPGRAAEKINTSFDPQDIEVIRSLNAIAKKSGFVVTNNIRELYMKFLSSSEGEEWKSSLELGYEAIEIDGSSFAIGSVAEDFYSKYRLQIVGGEINGSEKLKEYRFVNSNVWLDMRNRELLQIAFDNIASDLDQ